jgi:uncharacterized protein (TIRG00374 family)
MGLFTGEGVPFKTGFSTVIKFILFLGLGILIIWLSLRNLTDLEKHEILHSFRTANYNWVILVIFLGILSHLLRSLRWRLFFEPMGYMPSVKNTFYAVMIGYFANMAFPRLGEVSRCGILTRYENIPFNKAFGSVVTERALDLVIFVLLFLLTVFTQIGTIDNYLHTNVYPKILVKFEGTAFIRMALLVILLGIVSAVILGLVFRRRLASSRMVLKTRELIRGFWEGLRSLSRIRHPGLFICYTVAIWFLYYLMLYLCFFCFPETSALGPGAGLSALVLGSVGIMITPGGIGLYPAIIQETLRLYGTALTTGLALGWIAWTAQTAMIIVVGSISLLLLSFNRKYHGSPA